MREWFEGWKLEKFDQEAMLEAIEASVPRSRSTIYAEIAEGIFPRPLKIGRRSFWRDDEVADLAA